MSQLGADEESNAQRAAAAILDIICPQCVASPIITVAEFDAAIAAAGVDAKRVNICNRWKIRSISRGRYLRISAEYAIEQERQLHNYYANRWKLSK